MKFDYPFEYTETEIPPRCRKARLVRHRDAIRVQLRTVLPVTAPVVIIEHGHRFNKAGKWARYTRTYRWFQGQLFVPMKNRDGTPAELVVPKSDQHDSSGYLPRKQRVAAIRQWARQHIIIRGRIWRQIGEPRYVIQTFGLGGNHGGTALLADNGYNSNIAASMYYRIDHVDAAIKEAERIALSRGDTNDLPIRPSTRFTIRFPAALRLNPLRQHGKGDPFLNRVEAMIRRTKNPHASGALVMAMALGKP